MVLDHYLYHHFHIGSLEGGGGSQLILKMFCFCLPHRGWGRAYNDATISYRDNAVNIGRALLLPHWHRLQLTLRAHQSWPAVPPASLFHLTQIKERGNSSFASRMETMPRRGTSKHGPWKELIKSHPSCCPTTYLPQCDKKRNTFKFPSPLFFLVFLGL